MIIKKIIFSVLSLLLVLGGCSSSTVGIPMVDQVWLNNTCDALPQFKPDACALLDYCETSGTNDGSCNCQITDSFSNNASYVGTLLNGQFHGNGVYTSDQGNVYKGLWDQGQKHCGVETENLNFQVFRYGRIIEEGSGTDPTQDRINTTLLVVGGVVVIGLLIKAGQDYCDEQYEKYGYYNSCNNRYRSSYW